MSKTVLDDRTFFELVDEVLVRNGREPLRKNASQRNIIEVRDTDRVLQILAGPGSGKTEMLCWRVIFELVVRGTESERVLVTTFTNKAATELSVRLVERCDQLVALARDRHVAVEDPRVHDVRIGTIHSLCDALLAEFDDQYMAAGTQVIDEIETRVRMARDWNFAFRSAPAARFGSDWVLQQTEELVTLFRPPWLAPDLRWPGNKMEQVALMSSLLAQQTETWLPRCAKSGTRNGVEVVHRNTEGITERLEKIRKRWEAYLDRNHLLDFVNVQKRFADRQHLVREHLDHVFVDEFQDTNPIQFGIHMGWLARAGTRLTVVGDDDQALYRFRGSDIQCFLSVEPECKRRSVAFRRELLQENWRSTRIIVDFARWFRENSALVRVSMDKHVVAPTSAATGQAPRLLTGSWKDVSSCVARELAESGAGRYPTADQPKPPTAAVLMFSTSERASRNNPEPAATVLREALQRVGLRVYNPRNKTAGRDESPIAELLGLVSYLIDPVTTARAGKGGRLVQVFASCGKEERVGYAVSAPPPFPISQAHSSFQLAFVKADGGQIGQPVGDRAELLSFLDTIRANLVAANAPKDRPKLTLSGLIARILSFPRYRSSAYSQDLFRQAMFTSLLEANIAPTRMSRNSLDLPLIPSQGTNGKIVWPDQYWQLLNTMGTLISNTPLDDEEVEAFAEHAVVLMTFHQAKGLEFDHVYVAASGREPQVQAVLQTMLFSGEAPRYSVRGNNVQTRAAKVLELAEADRDREVYVALTRAKKTLTILVDPNDDRANMNLHSVLEAAFHGARARKHGSIPKVTVKEWSHG